MIPARTGRGGPGRGRRWSTPDGRSTGRDIESEDARHPPDAARRARLARPGRGDRQRFWRPGGGHPAPAPRGLPPPSWRCAISRAGGPMSIKTKGFTFDAGPTIITVPFVLEELAALAGKTIDRVRAPSSLATRSTGSTSPTDATFNYTWATQARLEAEIARFNPADVAGYRRPTWRTPRRSSPAPSPTWPTIRSIVFGRWSRSPPTSSSSAPTNRSIKPGLDVHHRPLSSPGLLVRAAA